MTLTVDRQTREIVIDINYENKIMNFLTLSKNWGVYNLAKHLLLSSVDNYIS